MMYLKKNVKIKPGYGCTALYDFNARETYLISNDNGQALLNRETDYVNTLLGGGLERAGLCTSDLTCAELAPTVFEYELFDDHHKYESCDTVYFEVTNKCNFHCIHCYASMGPEGNDYVSPDLMMLYIRNLEIQDRMNIRLTGGEPFLNPDIRELLRIVAETVRPFSRHSVVTNGSGKYDDILYALQLGFEVQISLYGLTHETFRKVSRVDLALYDRMRENLRRLSETEYASQIVCLFSINSLTYNEMKTFVDTIRSMGMRVILNRPSSVGRANENWDLLKLSPEQHMVFSRYNFSVAKGYNRYCYHACKLSWAYVDIMGNVRPCAFIRHSHCFGNLKESHFSEMRNTPEFEAFKQLNADSFDKCSRCELEYCCTGGCCGETLAHEGVITNSYVWCVVRPYQNPGYTDMDDHTIKRVQKYAGGTFDFFSVNSEEGGSET